MTNKSPASAVVVVESQIWKESQEAFTQADFDRICEGLGRTIGEVDWTILPGRGDAGDHDYTGPGMRLCGSIARQRTNPDEFLRRGV